MSTSERFSLRGKSALITGAVGILGREFAWALAEAGASVALVDRDQKACATLAEDLHRAFGTQHRGYGCDLRERDQIANVVAQARNDLGAITILHNNAAWKGSDLAKFFAAFEEYDLETWREVMSVNIDAMFLVAQAVGKQMIADGQGGSIIQTASIYGVVAPDQRIYQGSEYNGRPINTPAVYSASKAAVVGLSQYLATYWAPHQIRVNTLTPGGVESGQNGTFHKNYSARVPLGRMAQSEDLFGALIYLASDASRYVTGQNMIVDGGLSAW